MSIAFGNHPARVKSLPNAFFVHACNICGAAITVEPAKDVVVVIVVDNWRVVDVRVEGIGV